MNPPVKGIGAIFMRLDVHNSIGVRNERTEFTLSDKPNWLRNEPSSNIRNAAPIAWTGKTSRER
jgi:hypothetical protein